MHQRSTSVSFELTPFIHMLKKPTISPISLAKKKNQTILISHLFFLTWALQKQHHLKGELETAMLPKKINKKTWN